MHSSEMYTKFTIFQLNNIDIHHLFTPKLC